MKSSPAGGSRVERELSSDQLSFAPLGPEVIATTRRSAHDVLEAQDSSLPENPEVHTLAQSLDAHSVVSNATLDGVKKVATAPLAAIVAGAVLPGCDATTVLCGMGTSGLILAGLGYAGYKAIFDTVNVGAGEVAVITRRGERGWIHSKLLRGDNVQFLPEGANPVFKGVWTVEDRFRDTIITYPAKNIDSAEPNDFKAKIRTTPSPSVAATTTTPAISATPGNVEHVFSWSVEARIFGPSAYGVFYRNFKKKFDDKTQSEKIYDATQKALQAAVIKLGFRDLTDIQSKRADIIREVQNDERVQALKTDYGLEIKFILGDISAPSSINQLATVAAEQPLRLATAKASVDIANAEGERDVVAARRRAEAMSLETAALKEQGDALGVTSNAFAALGFTALHRPDSLAQLLGKSVSTNQAPDSSKQDPNKK